MQKLQCGNCGGKVPVPAGYPKAKIRCNLCGYYAPVPPEMRSASPAEDEPPPKKKAPPPRTVVQPDDDGDPDPVTPAEARPEPPPKKKKKPKPSPPPAARARTDPRDTRPEFVPQEGVGKPYLEGTQDEDDDRPYAVEGDGLKTCPECMGELPHDAAFCVHCGSHLGEGERKRRPKKKRTYTEIDREFVEGFPLTTRLALLAGVMLLNVILTVTLLKVVADDGKIDAVGIGTGVVTFLVQTALQAFIMGSYDTLRVQRNEKGKGTLTRSRRLAFIPLPPETINWKGHVGVGRIAVHSGGVLDWATCLYLLLCSGCLPGVLFWWFVLKSERYHAVLCNMYGGVEDALFRGKDQKQAEEVVEVVGDATGLDVKGVL